MSTFARAAHSVRSGVRMSRHILHGVRSLKPEAGSIAIGLVGLLQWLRGADIESTVVTLEPEIGDYGDVEVVCVGQADCRALVEGADVVHLHGLERELARCLVPAAKRLGVPYVISPLGGCSPNPYIRLGWRERWFGAFQDRRMLRGARAIGVLNEAEGAVLVGRGLSGRVHRLPYGVDFREYEPLADDREARSWDEPRTLLVLGDIHPDQGLVVLMRAVAELGKDFRGWRVVIAGGDRGGWLAQLEAAVERKGGSERVAFVRDPDGATQRRWLGEASLVAAPALRVCCPISVGQGLASGVPVIASGSGLADGAESSVRVCEPTREGLRAGLGEMIRAVNAGGGKLPRASRESAREFFDWTYLHEGFVRLYRSAWA